MKKIHIKKAKTNEFVEQFLLQMLHDIGYIVDYKYKGDKSRIKFRENNIVVSIIYDPNKHSGYTDISDCALNARMSDTKVEYYPEDSPPILYKQGSLASIADLRMKKYAHIR